METMTKPTEELASTLEAFRVFDRDGRGAINSKMIREIMLKSLEQVSRHEVYDLLEGLGLIQDRTITYEGMSIRFTNKHDEKIYSIKCYSKKIRFDQ